LPAEEAALPPGQIRHRGKLIIDLEAIVEGQISPDQPDQRLWSDCPNWAGFPKSGQAIILYYRIIE
jgi:hypothetical protein